MFCDVQCHIMQPVGDPLGELAHRVGRIALVRGAQISNGEWLADEREHASAEEALARISQTYGHDLQAEPPVTFDFCAERDARSTRAHGQQGRLGVTLAFRVDLHGITRAQRGDGAAKSVFVAMHLCRVILLSVNRQTAETTQHGTDKALLEERRFGERSGRTSGDAEDDERIEQAVGMVHHDEHRSGGHAATAALNALEDGGGATDQTRDPLIHWHAQGCTRHGRATSFPQSPPFRYVPMCIQRISPTRSRYDSRRPCSGSRRPSAPSCDAV